MESSPSCTLHPCGMFPNQGSSSIHFHHFRVKNKSRHTEKLYLFSSPVSHVTDTLFVKTWGGKSYAKSVACEQIPSDISIAHAVPARQIPWKAEARSSVEQWLSTGILPCLPLGNSFLLLWWGFYEIVRSVCLWFLCCALFPFISLQWLQVALLFFFLIFQSCYWLLIQGQNIFIPSQFAWRKADNCNVNSSRIDLSACCPSNIQAARHILCNKNTVQTIAGFNWKIRCSVILDGWFSANYKVGWAPLESQQCLINFSLQVIQWLNCGTVATSGQESLLSC